MRVKPKKTLLAAFATVCASVLFGLLPLIANGASSAWDNWKGSYDAEMAKLAAAAKSEGKLIMYFGTEPKPYMDEATKYFKATYGISVEFLTLRAPEVLARIRAEASTGQVMGDLHMTGGGVTRGVANDGHYASYIPLAAKEPAVKWLIDPLLDQKEKSLEGKGVPVVVYPEPNGVVINRKLLPPERMPKNFKDFLNPFFKGKMAFNDPRVPGSGVPYFLHMVRTYGNEYFEKLKAQNIVLERSYPVGIRAVASGEYLIFIGIASRMVKGMDEANIGVIYPEGPLPGIVQMGIIKNCPHPNASKLFLNFALSKIGQEIASKFADRTPVRDDVKAATKLVDISGMEITVPSFEEDLVIKPKMSGEAKKIFGE